MERENVALVVSEVASVTCTVKVELPAAKGIPEMVPNLRRAKPAGKEPAEIDQEYGGVPPMARNACQYGIPAAAAGSGDKVVIKNPGRPVTENVALTVAAAVSSTSTVKLKVPVANRAPVRAPDALSARPGGRPPGADQL